MKHKSLTATMLRGVPAKSRNHLWLLVLWLAAVFLAGPSLASASADHPTEAPPVLVRLPGHVLPALANASIVPSSAKSESEPITVTLVLKRDNQAGFDRYLHDVYNPKSKIFRHFLTQRGIAARFGPSRQAYHEVLAYLRAHGFRLVEGSANHLTITVRGTRTKVERTFDVRIGDYKIAERAFYANDRDPSLPTQLASQVQSVAGLSNLASPARALPSEALGASIGPAPDLELTETLCFAFTPITSLDLVGVLASYYINAIRVDAAPLFAAACLSALTASGIAIAVCNQAARTGNSIANLPGCTDFFNAGIGSPNSPAKGSRRESAADTNLGKNPQKIGLLEFDTFNPSDVSNWLTLAGGGATFGELSEVAVNGGVTAPGPGEPEVLLDVDTVMLLASLSGKSYVVYEAPSGTSFQTMFNAMINDGDTVISNSCSECEDQMTLADVQGIDTVLQSATAAGISVFNGAGDSGSTCLDGTPNTVGVPADSPNATAVGGSSPVLGPGLTYGSETWWNGLEHMPPTGQGGFGSANSSALPVIRAD